MYKIVAFRQNTELNGVGGADYRVFRDFNMNIMCKIADIMNI